MAVGIPLARTRHSEFGIQQLKRLLGNSDLRTMMTHFEHVDIPHLIRVFRKLILFRITRKKHVQTRPLTIAIRYVQAEGVGIFLTRDQTLGPYNPTGELPHTDHIAYLHLDNLLRDA